MDIARRDLLRVAGVTAVIGGSVEAQTDWRSRLSPAVAGFMQSAGQTLTRNIMNGTATPEHFHNMATAFQVYMANVGEAGGTPIIEQAVKKLLSQKVPLTPAQVAGVLTTAQQAIGVSLPAAMVQRLITSHYAGFQALASRFTSLADANTGVVDTLNAGAQYASLIRKAQGENLSNFCFYATWVTTYTSVVLYVAGIADVILIPVGVTLLWLC